MSTQEKDGLVDCLFSRQDRKLINIKFMRGSAKVIAPADLRGAVSKMVHQRGTEAASSGPAKSGRAQVNIRQLVANL